MKNQDDISIIKGIKDGNEKALYQCIEKYKSFVAYIVGNIMGRSYSKADQEEVIADVFIAIWEHANTIDEKQFRHFKAYIGTIARNKAKNKLRSTHNHTYDLELDDTIVVEECDTSTVLLDKEIQQIIISCIKQLSKEEQKCFIYYYYYRKTIRVIAQELNLNESTVKSKLYRGRDKLKSMLQEEMKR